MIEPQQPLSTHTYYLYIRLCKCIVEGVEIFIKCEALLVLGISARRRTDARTDARTYLLASTLLQIFKDFTLIKDRGFFINDWGFRTQRTHDVSVYTNFQECTAAFIQLM